MDDEKFDLVWRAHGPAVLRYCTYSTGSSQDGEDIAAETFIQFLTKGNHVGAEFVEAWLIRVARNLCATHHRKAKRRQLLHSDLTENFSVETTDLLSQDSWDYLRKLKEHERLIIYLRIAENRSFTDIAQLLGKSESASKMIFYRAIDRLRRNMMRDDAGTDTTPIGGTNYV